MKYCVIINNERDGQTADATTYGPFYTREKAEAFAAKCQARLDRRETEEFQFSDVVIFVSALRPLRLRDAYDLLDGFDD